MTEKVTSTGSVGLDLYRSDGRAYRTQEKIYRDPQKLLGDLEDISRVSRERGRRRWVLRGVVSQPLAEDLTGNDQLEVNIPLSVMHGNFTHKLVMMADNIHRSEIPEWDEVYRFWQNPYPKEINPVMNVYSIPERFSVTDRVDNRDVEDLMEIWQPFGWTEAGIREFIEVKDAATYQLQATQRDLERLNHRQWTSVHRREWISMDVSSVHGLWFSGIRDRFSGRLVSACQAESIYFGGILLVEDTEFGTKSEFQGLGLNTAAVTALNAQILSDTLYGDSHFNLRHSRIAPLIYSELSMTSRSDVIGRKVGMTIPLVEGQTGLEQPAQVIRRNVAVLDGQATNDLSLNELGTEREHFRQAYGENFPYWRNFIAGVLTKAAIDGYYSRRQCQQILSRG